MTLPWKIAAIAVLALGIFLAWGRYTDVVDDRDRYRAERDQVRADYKLCKDDQKLTEEVANDYESKNADLVRARDDLLKRLRRSADTCVPVALAACKCNAASAGNGFPEAVGVEAATIVDEAAACDENTNKLIVLQDFIKRTFATRPAR